LPTDSYEELSGRYLMASHELLVVHRIMVAEELTEQAAHGKHQGKLDASLPYLCNRWEKEVLKKKES
jgi:hypothetical protein